MSVVVPIPGGGEAELWTVKELTPRMRKPVVMAMAMLGNRFMRIVMATRLFIGDDCVADKSKLLGEDGKPVFKGGDVYISRRELELMGEVNDAGVVAHLKSWTLDLPLPRTLDELLDMPHVDVYDTLLAEVAKLMVEDDDLGFTVDSVEDKRSPTGASSASTPRLGPTVKKSGSTRSGARGSRSTSTAKHSPA